MFTNLNHDIEQDISYFLSEHSRYDTPRFAVFIACLFLFDWVFALFDRALTSSWASRILRYCLKYIKYSFNILTLIRLSNWMLAAVVIEIVPWLNKVAVVIFVMKYCEITEFSVWFYQYLGFTNILPRTISSCLPG